MIVDVVALRPAGPDDVDFLAEVVLEANRARCEARPEPWDTPEHRRGLRDDAAEQVAGRVPDSVTSVIEVAGRSVGRLRLVRTGDRFEIAGLQLLPDRQNQGTGTVVIRRVQDEARALGLPVELDVEPDNPDAARLYRRLGFLPVGRGADGSTRMRCPPVLDRRAYLATLPRRRLAAGAVIRDTAGRVCLVEPTYKEHWILPGGTVEAGESPAEGCRREVVEELGVELPIGRLLVLDTVAPRPPDDPHGALIFGYDGGVCDEATIASFVLPAGELRSFRFVHPDEAAQLLDSTNLDRVLRALDALRTGGLSET